MKSEEGHIMDEKLVKYLLGEASEAEQAEVHAWLSASETNKKYFAGFKLIWDQSSALASQSNVSTDDAWERFKQRTQKRKPRLVPLLYSRVMVAAILLLLAGGCWLVYIISGPTKQQVVADRLTTTNSTQTAKDSIETRSITTNNNLKKDDYAPAKATASNKKQTAIVAVTKHKPKVNNNIATVPTSAAIDNDSKEKKSTVQKNWAASTSADVDQTKPMRHMEDEAVAPYPLGDTAILFSKMARDTATLAIAAKQKNSLADASFTSASVYQQQDADAVMAAPHHAAAFSRSKNMNGVMASKAAKHQKGVSQITTDGNIRVVHGAGWGTFIITGKVPSPNKVALKITDVPGKTVYTDSLDVNNGNINATIHMPDKTPTGMYILNLRSDSFNYTLKITVE